MAPDVFSLEEVLPLNKIQELQLVRLRETVERAMNVPFYKSYFDKNKITSDSVRSLDDIKRLPFTLKKDMREQYPLGLLAIDKSNIARIHGSSGTTGKPTFVAYSYNDLVTWSELCARFLYAGGLRKSDLVQVAFGYGLFTGGFGLHYGIERLGAAVVPMSSGNTARQLTIMNDLKPQALVCTPSYALNLAESIRKEGFDPQSISLRHGFFGGEMWTEEMRLQIEEELPITATNNYGLSEVIGPGISGDCLEMTGMHIQEDHFIVECVNPDTLEPVPDGEEGELVITSLTKEAMPMIRYRTRDIAKIYRIPCPCGRTGLQMSRIKGRTDDMMIIRGVNVFPSQIEEAILNVDGFLPQYVIELSRTGALDEAVVKVEVDDLFSDKMCEMVVLRERLARQIQSVAGIHVKVELLASGSIERSVGKAKRVIDKRNLTS